MKFSNIEDSVINAYSNANYRVIVDKPFDIRIGEKSEPLRDYCFKQNYHSAVFVTSYNPFSKILGERSNVLAHNKLKRILNCMGINFILCIAADPAKIWPNEVGVLALDIDLQLAKDIGIKFKQNAIVWIPNSWVPRIELLR